MCVCEVVIEEGLAVQDVGAECEEVRDEAFVLNGVDHWRLRASISSTICCSVLQCVVGCCGVLRGGAECCRVLQCVAAC